MPEYESESAQDAVTTRELVRMLLELEMAGQYDLQGEYDSEQAPVNVDDADLQACRLAGWLEEQDILNADKPLERRNLARILHEYLRRVRGVRDLPDITPDYELKDLFDCRICADHIAQVVLRGLMEPVRIGDLCIFDGHRLCDKKEAEAAVTRLLLL